LKNLQTTSISIILVYLQHPFVLKLGFTAGTRNYSYSETIWLLGRPRRRWVDNIRMDLGEVGWGDVDWIDLAQDRNRWRAHLNSVLNLLVP
jgi:hypothetical protein